MDLWIKYFAFSFLTFPILSLCRFAKKKIVIITRRYTPYLDIGRYIDFIFSGDRVGS